MAWVARLGSALYISSGGVEHLHFVCSDPFTKQDYPPDSCLVVNVSSVVPKCDTTLILKVGDHPFISHDSFVYFKMAHLKQARDMETLVRQGVYRVAENADRSLIKRIVVCMETSNFASMDMARIAREVYDLTNW
jgi:hypothetical protein